MVRLRSFGKFSYRVADSEVLLNTLVGTQGKFTTDEISGYLKDLIVSRLTDVLGTLKVSMLDLPARFEELGAATRIKLADEFKKYGLEFVDFFINAITPPEEVQKAIDARSSMGAIGDLRSFTMYQAANSMAKMAESRGAAGETGSNAMGMGMGAGFGMMMPAMLQQAMQSMVPTPTGPAGAAAPDAGQGASQGRGLDFGALAAGSTDPKTTRPGRRQRSGLENHRNQRRMANQCAHRRAAPTTGDRRVQRPGRRLARGDLLFICLRTCIRAHRDAAVAI